MLTVTRVLGVNRRNVTKGFAKTSLEPQTSCQKAEQHISFFQHRDRRQQSATMPPRTALLVIDMQKEFKSIITHSLPNVQKLIAYSESSSVPLIFVQHGHSKEELTTNPSPNQLVRKWGAEDSLEFGSDKWQIIDELQEHAKSRKLVYKNTYDSFLNTNLQQILDEEKIERVVICGLMTDACCDITGRSAFNRGFETWLIGDACATDDDEQHKAALKTFGLLYGEVLTTSEAIDRLESGGKCA